MGNHPNLLGGAPAPGGAEVFALSYPRPYARPLPRETREFSSVSSAARTRSRVARVVDQVPVDDVGQPSFQAAHRLRGSPARRLLPVEVLPCLGGLPELMYDGRPV